MVPHGLWVWVEVAGRGSLWRQSTTTVLSHLCGYPWTVEQYCFSSVTAWIALCSVEGKPSGFKHFTEGGSWAGPGSQLEGWGRGLWIEGQGRGVRRMKDVPESTGKALEP